MTPQTIDNFTAFDTIGRPVNSQFKYAPAGAGPSYSSPGDQITFLITGAETGGAYFVAEVFVPVGGGVPLHVHQREEESFYVLEGTLNIQVGSTTLNASPGDLVYLPRGVPHSFRNTGTADAKFLLVVTPAGLEKFFEETFYPTVDRSAPLPPATEAFKARLFAAAFKYGVMIPPPA